MRSEYEIFRAIEQEIKDMRIPNLTILVENRFGTWIPDISLFQHDKCACIIEIKGYRPTRELILKYINQCRIALSKFEIGGFILAYPNDNRIVYLDCTDAVFSQERDIGYLIDSILQSSKIELFDILSPYCSFYSNPSIIRDAKEKKAKTNCLGIVLWLVSIIIAIVVLTIDLIKNASSLSWERVCLIGLILLFSCLQLIEKATIRKDGIELYTLARDSKPDGSRVDN